MASAIVSLTLVVNLWAVQARGLPLGGWVRSEERALVSVVD